MPDDIHFDASARQKKNRRGYGSRARFRRQLKEAGASTCAEYLQSDHWRGLKASWVPRRTWQRKPSASCASAGLAHSSCITRIIVGSAASHESI
jgi:hypothetical protein